MSANDAEAVVDRFLATWPRADVDELLAFFADDGVWHNIPMAPAVGTDQIRALLEQFAVAMGGMRVEVHHQMSDGRFVMNERTDHLAMGDKVVALPVCGVFEIEDGRIKAWRDYFDLAVFSGGS